MKLSTNTIQILRNLSTINGSLFFKRGNHQSTISPLKNIIVYATIEENFPQDCGIYDLGEFLNALSLVEDPDLEFSDKYVTIKNATTSIQYVFSPESVIIRPPESKIKMPDPDIEFDMPEADLKRVQKAAGVMGLSDIGVTVNGDSMIYRAFVGGDTSSNKYDQTIDPTGYSDRKFNMVFKVENLKMMSGDYKVGISSKNISRFMNVAGTMEYYVSLERTSDYNQ